MRNTKQNFIIEQQNTLQVLHQFTVTKGSTKINMANTVASTEQLNRETQVKQINIRIKSKCVNCTMANLGIIHAGNYE